MLSQKTPGQNASRFFFGLAVLEFSWSFCCSLWFAVHRISFPGEFASTYAGEMFLALGFFVGEKKSA